MGGETLGRHSQSVSGSVAEPMTHWPQALPCERQLLQLRLGNQCFFEPRRLQSMKLFTRLPKSPRPQNPPSLRAAALGDDAGVGCGVGA
eukprot:5232537-Alexandrium_andersonii.AAC.1